MNIIEIDSLEREELRPFAKLTEAQLRNRLEPEKGMFIAESPKVIATALDARYEAVSFLMERRHIEGDAAAILARCPDATVYTAEREVLEGLTGYVLTRGVLAAMRRKALPTLEQVLDGSSRIAVLENIVDATNLGAIFRSAAALGIDAVLLTPSCADPLNRRSVRVSMGCVFLVPWTYIGTDPSEWPHPGLERLSALGFKSVAMALSHDTVAIDDECLKREERLAIVLGTEGDGLADETCADCDYTAKIPMLHGVDSLNVAAAGAVAFWELRIKK